MINYKIMELSLKLILIELFAYFCGSIPFGLIISKLVKNIDIRNYGSHNIGSTNVARTLGKKWGAVVLLLDGLKAVIPLLIVKYFYGNDEFILSITVSVIVLGHIFSVWLNFEGGKGIACILFSLLILDWKLGVLFLVVWIGMFLLFKISALSALTAIIVVSIASFFTSIDYFTMMLFLSALTFYKHKDNIRRMINKEELKFENNGDKSRK